MHKVRDLIYNILFVLAFMCVASGMLEDLVLKLLDMVGW